MLTKDLMTTNVTIANPGHSIWHAAQMMLDHDVSGLPVVDDNGHLVGMLTQGDLLRRIELGTGTLAGTGTAPVAPERRLGAYVKTHSWKVDDVMTTNVIAVEEETPIGGVATLMDQHGIGRLPVSSKGKTCRHYQPQGYSARYRDRQARCYRPGRCGNAARYSGAAW